MLWKKCLYSGGVRVRQRGKSAAVGSGYVAVHTVRVAWIPRTLGPIGNPTRIYSLILRVHLDQMVVLVSFSYTPSL